MHRKLYFVVFSVLLIAVSEVQAYDNEKTHKKLTEKSVESSNLSANTGRYLSKNLGRKFKKNIETIIGDKKVIDWFQDGSDFEDSGPDTSICRASNHFHNPLKPWDQAQMTDGVISFRNLFVDAICMLRLQPWLQDDRKSNVSWATSYLAPAPDGDKVDISRQKWGWDDGRKFYLEALQSATKDERDTAFTNTFRTVGHIVHLIQDGAQPAHVRNDFVSHLRIGIDSQFRAWKGSEYEHFVKVRTDEIVNSTTPIKPEIEEPSLTDFWDTDQYVLGGEPSTGLDQGITEITNANYFSLNTIPREDWPAYWVGPPEGRGDPADRVWVDEALYHEFPYPKITNQTAKLCNGILSGNIIYRYLVSSAAECNNDNYIARTEFRATTSILNDPKLVCCRRYFSTTLYAGR